MRRSLPGLLRLTVLVGLAGFWVAVALLTAVLADWSRDVVAVLAIGLAGALVPLLGLLGQVWERTQAARRSVRSPVQRSRAGRPA